MEALLCGRSDGPPQCFTALAAHLARANPVPFAHAVRSAPGGCRDVRERGFGVGLCWTFGGLFSALRAAGVDPSQALRSE